MGKISLSRSVSILALTAGLLGSTDGWGTNYIWRATGGPGYFYTPGNWDRNSSYPQATDTIEFDGTGGLYPDVTSATSIKGITFDAGPPQAHAFSLFFSGADVGSSGYHTVAVGTEYLETINLSNSTTHGNFGTSDYTSSLQLLIRQ